MKKLMFVLTAVCLFASASLAFAQDPRDVGVFADEAGTTSDISAIAFAPFFFYVVGFDMDGQVKGWELKVINPDPSMVVLNRTLDQAGSLNVGTLDNFIVGSGGCFNGTGAYRFVTYNAGYFVPAVPNDVVICLGPSTPSSFAPAVPGYLQCDGSLHPLGVAQNGQGTYPNGCGVINPTSPGVIVGTVETSFGAVKAGF